jgi:hypothetical protein
MDDQNDDRDHTAEAHPREHAGGSEPPAAPAPARARKKRPGSNTPQGKARVRHIMRPEPPDGSAVAPTRKKGPGPNTPESKARIRLNAVRSGIYAVDLVIPGLEREEDWQVYRAAMLEDLAPEGHLQTCLAQRVAEVLWRLNRVTLAERNEFARANKGKTELRMPPSNELEKIIRGEAHLNRQWVQAKHELEVQQKQRRGEATPLARLDVQGGLEE